MKTLFLGIAAAGLLTSGISLAQTASPGAAPAQGMAPTTATTPATGMRPTGTTATSTAANGSTANRDRSAAASGDNNQAVATTNANSPAPAKGANSFTMGEAKSRLEKNGFSNVGGLTKDDNGVWHGNAQKDGSTTTVWLDYKGNTGTAK
jgi:hypothetical protein